MSEEKPNHNRVWWGLLILGLLLHLSSVANSDYGLDTHLHLAVIESNEDGTPNLEWGDVRPSDPLASNPSEEQILERGWWQILELYPSWLLPFAAFLPMLALICLVLVMTKGQPQLAALVALHPSFIFATGRLYPESTVALAVAGIVIASLNLFRQRGWTLLQWILLAVASVHLLVLVKGLSSTIGWGLLGILFAWILLDRTVPKLNSYSRDPLKALSLSIPLVLIAMIAASFSTGGSLATIQTHSVAWLFALLIAFLDGFGLYLLVGLCCWPFVSDFVTYAKQSKDNESVFLTIFVASGTLLMSMWIASLWVFEADRWGLPLWENMIVMGNNGRYLTALMFPLVLLVHRSMKGKEIALVRPLVLALILVLPLSMLAGIHGQTMWTDDAAKSFSDDLENGDDFLYIDDEALAMHWLYTFRLELDPDGERNITGHWRAPESNWQVELEGQAVINRGDLSDVRFIVVAPGLDMDLPEGWQQTANGEAPFLNGGGEWKVYRTS
tara:strand:+ start:2003 stop:3502 length:1500 start_codon:yes stop_codon:yes gene_type:complete